VARYNGVMDSSRARTALKTGATVLLLLLAGILAWALWPQELRFERVSGAGRERVAVCTQWGFVVKESVLDEGGTAVRTRRFPLGRVPLWRIGALPSEPGAWREPGEAAAP